MTGEEEVHCTCPHCFSAISFLLETFYGEQTYIEDCEVCCQPIQITYTVEDNKVTNLQVKGLED